MLSFIRERPHRLPREFYKGCVTGSFTACINELKRPFVDASIVAELVARLSIAAKKHDCIVAVYCFMPDHLHLMLHGITEKADMWQAMVNFKQSSGYWFGRNRPEFRWQKDFHDRVIRDPAERAVRVRYIADNPVRGKLVARWSDYRYTGAIGCDLAAVFADVATD